MGVLSFGLSGLQTQKQRKESLWSVYVLEVIKCVMNNNKKGPEKVVTLERKRGGVFFWVLQAVETQIKNMKSKRKGFQGVSFVFSEDR